MAKFNGRGSLYRLVSILGVSTYLVVAYIYLRALGRLKPQHPFLKLAVLPFRKPYIGFLTQMNPETGHCYTSQLPDSLLSDADGCSRLRIFEDGFPLATRGSHHDKVRNVGVGAFSHWGNHIYFSTSDNSDPRTNGRVYSVKEVTR